MTYTTRLALSCTIYCERQIYQQCDFFLRFIYLFLFSLKKKKSIAGNTIMRFLHDKDKCACGTPEYLYIIFGVLVVEKIIVGIEHSLLQYNNII